MLKHLYLLLIPFLFAGESLAQCDQCDKVAGDDTDHCFIDAEFAGKCASFVEGADYAYLQKKAGSVSKIKLATEGQSVVSWLVSLSENKKLKADVADILFLERAAADWKGAEKTVNMMKTPSGLMYKFFNKTDERTPESGKNVSVHYKGYLEDGKVFDSSYSRGQPITFILGAGRVIKGWDEGIQLFPIGSKGILRIPPELGYGARGAGGSIPPNATLYFEIEVVEAD